MPRQCPLEASSSSGQHHCGWRPRRGRAGQGVPVWGEQDLASAKGLMQTAAEPVIIRGGWQANNGPHSPASWPWPLVLGRQPPPLALHVAHVLLTKWSLSPGTCQELTCPHCSGEG